MHLKVLLPSGVFADVADVIRVVVVTNAGSLGILPRRMDCAAAVVPGIMEYQTAQGEIHYTALDAGVMVKVGPEVRISVRRAFAGGGLAHLQGQVAQAFLQQTDAEIEARAVLAKLESGFLQRFAEIRHE